MCDRVIHQRSFYDYERVFEFDTAIDVFKVIHVETYNGLPTVWYETLDNPIYRRKVRLELIYDYEYIPDNSVHVGSCLFGPNIIHVYQVLASK